MAQWQNASNSKYLICSASNVHRWRHFYLCQQNIRVLCCFSYIFFLFWIWIPCGRQYKCSCHKQNCPKLFDIQKRHTKSTPADEPNDKIYKQICIFFALCCSIFGLNQRFDRFGIGFINPFLRRNCSPFGKHSFFG